MRLAYPLPAGPNQPGPISRPAALHGFGGANTHGVVGTGGVSGDGVQGLGNGTGSGVHGVGTGNGIGVLAENLAGSTAGIALKATGRTVFSRNGVLTAAAGHSTATMPGVALTPASLVLATLPQHAAGVYILAAVPNVAGSSFKVYLSKAGPAR